MAVKLNTRSTLVNPLDFIRLLITYHANLPQAKKSMTTEQLSRFACDISHDYASQGFCSCHKDN